MCTMRKQSFSFAHLQFDFFFLNDALNNVHTDVLRELLIGQLAVSDIANASPPIDLT